MVLDAQLVFSFSSIDHRIGFDLIISYLISTFIQYIDSPDIEKEVKRLLKTDMEAVSVRILLLCRQ